jgi:hypothetical protein
LVDVDFCQADATAGENEAKYIACEDIASATEGWFCTKARIKKPSTVGTGGAVTRGDTGGTTGDILFLSTTQGKAVEVPDGDGILQVVGQVLSQDEVILEPGEVFYLAEKESAAKTVGASDSGKAFAVVGASSATVVTLPATAAGLTYTIINVAQDADGAIQVSPVSADQIAGVDITEADNKDLINTSATQRCMDLVKVVGNGAAGWFVTDIRGTWAIES